VRKIVLVRRFCVQALVLEDGRHASEAGLHLEVRTSHEELDQMPAFHRYEEATTQELFFDLFFVANLTTFTSLKEINDSSSLRAYIGFSPCPG
jgi:hypothetical protein